MLTVMKEELHEFLNNTSLHGVKFITTRNNATERIIWLAVCCAAMLGTFIVAGSIWTAFQTSPTQTIVEDPSFPVWNIDFPALTICNMNKVQFSKARRIMPQYLGKNVDNTTERLFLDSLLALSLMRYPYYHHPQIFVKRGNKKLMDFSGFNISNIMLKVMPKQKELFGTCYWKGREVPCDSLFRHQVTEEGYCYSFNSKSAQNPASLDMDSPPSQDRYGNKQPWRNNAAGKTTGLEVFFVSAEDQYLPSDERKPGYNLIVHDSSELPDVSRGLFLPRSNGHVTLLAVTATRVRASSDLERLTMQERKCQLPSDGEEMQSYCWTKCRMSAIVQRCNCVPYFGINTVAAGTRQCTNTDIACLADYNTQQRNIKPPAGSKGFRKSDLDLAIHCNCPASCSSTTYKTELLTAKRIDPFPYDDYAYLDFYFKDMEVVSYVRDIKFGIMDLIVSFGGMAGLFLGFSLISGIEVLYYLARVAIKIATSSRQGTVNHHDKVKDMDHAQIVSIINPNIRKKKTINVKAAWDPFPYQP